MIPQARGPEFLDDMSDFLDILGFEFLGEVILFGWRDYKSLRQEVRPLGWYFYHAIRQDLRLSLSG